MRGVNISLATVSSKMLYTLLFIIPQILNHIIILAKRDENVYFILGSLQLALFPVLK